ncbi:LamG-like jellyroll fold domain-containing protein [Frigoriflavimonas asaccharolytica]|uniref:Fibronectin type-III domain-containing protein n=1 Tax=Frigoriflavimonas asaccharolytica TaxID=2735899 RepID=A0A8J8G4U2_9FLAO|nr:LamG-like jellyroll fold domain-containing protein [Frigoriflavimonas asaccharolytica]NRS91284.1 hypothetical protein [Frigoriflavimonas asaccharolytica]
MKTKLLLLFLVITTFAKAQVTFSENFDAATPDLTGWVYTDFTIGGSIACSGTKSLTKDFNAVNSTGRVTTKNYVSTGGDITFTHTLRMLILGPNNAQANFKIGYSVNNGSDVTVLNAMGGYVPSCSAGFPMTIPGSAVPAGSNVKIFVQYQQADYTFRLGLDNFAAVQQAAPTVVSATANPIFNGGTINYVLNANTLATTSVINYGLSSTALSNQILGSNASGSTDTAFAADITGLLPATTYYYQVVATNSFGSTSSTINSFITGTSEPIAEYNFNNTMNNINGNSPFAVNSSTYVAGRDSNSQMALQTNNFGRSAIIPNLPVGTVSRTVSIWYKVTGTSANNTLFVYGAGSGESAYGVSFNTTNTWYNFAWNTSTSFSNASNDGQWHHLVTTFDSSKTTKMYVDGVLKNTVVQNGWNTSTSGNVFWLAGQFGNSSPFNGAVDDLKIYNYALTQAQVTALFTNATLATTENTIKTKDISIYPNPAKDFVNIQSENKVQTVEIYNMAGQKVLETREMKINTSNLKPGVYMVKIKDVDNQISSQKLIIK